MSAPAGKQSSPQRRPHLPIPRPIRRLPHTPHSRRSLSCAVAAKTIVYIHVTLRCHSPSQHLSRDEFGVAGD